MQLGIDISTDAVRVACMHAGRACMLNFGDGAQSFPALARQTMHGLVLGEAAAQALVGNQETTVQGCTRLMGRPAQALQLRERLPFDIREHNGEILCNLLYDEVQASTIYGQLIREAIERAQATLGMQAERVVLSVPASAEDRFRIQARTAAQAAGIRIDRLINQPAAALLALQAHNPPANQGAVAIVACGGGTTEVSIAQPHGQGYRIQATSADAMLGGEDMIWAVAEQLNQRFQAQAGIDVMHVGDSRTQAYGLFRASQQAMQRLSELYETLLTLDHGGGFGRDLAIVLRRADVDAWLKAHMQRVAKLCRHCLRAAKLNPEAISRVVLIGDWTWIPSLRECIADAFAKAVAELYSTEAADLAALGAAMAAQEQAPSVWDVTPYALGIACYYTDQELFSPIISANTAIPTAPIGTAEAHSQAYWTRHPDQDSATLSVLQYRGLRNADPYGTEKVQPQECELLGRWEFRGLQPKRGQHASFTVSFAIDLDGILQLKACETATGHMLEARVEF